MKFEEDLKKLKNKMVKDIDFAKDVYKALCNTQWREADGSYVYGCTWRYAGGLIAEIRNRGETYLDFYLSGREGQVTPKVERIFNGLGWVKEPYKEE